MKDKYFGAVYQHSLYEPSYNEDETINHQNVLNAGYTTSSYLDEDKEMDPILKEAYDAIPV